MDKVLIIDDDRFTQNVLQKSLYKSYEVRTADGGDMGIKLAREWHPNVILLDVEMPGRNGYEVCDELKQDTVTEDIPIVFLSSRSSVRERMLGFEVGGDDYLVKPCSAEILQTKISKLSQIFQQRHILKQGLSTAEKTAMEAMASNSELGKAVRFVERTYGVSSYDVLGKALMEVMSELQLSACAMFKDHSTSHFYSSTMDRVAPLEAEILQMLHSPQRFVDFGCRTQINYPHVAVLIKNMPLDDRARYGRIKDSIPFILGSTDAKLKVMEAEKSLTEQNRSLMMAVSQLQDLLMNVSGEVERNSTSVGDIMTRLTTELGMDMHRLGPVSVQ